MKISIKNNSVLKDKTFKYDVIDFLIMDFKEISEKLESTDKKVQFCTQLYITLITAVLAFVGSDFLKAEKDNYLYFSFIFFALYIIGQFVLFYLMSGQKIHMDYVCKLNVIRYLILKQLNKSECFIERYGYTKCVPPNRKGMNYWMIYLTAIAMFSFFAFALYFVWQKNKSCCMAPIIILLLLTVLLFNCNNMKKHHKNMVEDTKRYEKNKISAYKELIRNG